MEVIKDGDIVPIVPDSRIFTDPRNFKESDTPIIMLVDDLRSFSGWAIKQHTVGNYNHVTIINKPGMLVSQNFTGFNANKIDVYLTPGMMLKFWRIKDLSVVEKTAIEEAILRRLGMPWWRRTYDFLGTFVGQLIHVKWIQNPFAEFCSEEVNDDYIQQVTRARAMDITRPSPSELNTYFVKHPELMECLGYWWSD